MAALACFCAVLDWDGRLPPLKSLSPSLPLSPLPFFFADLLGAAHGGRCIVRYAAIVELHRNSSPQQHPCITSLQGTSSYWCTSSKQGTSSYWCTSSKQGTSSYWCTVLVHSRAASPVQVHVASPARLCSQVADYYVAQSKAVHHGVREAACACIAELAEKVRSKGGGGGAGEWHGKVGRWRRR